MTRPPALIVRTATPADAPALVAMIDALAASEKEPRGHFTLERALEDVFGPTAALTALVAESGGQVVGYATYEPSYSTEWARRGLYMQDLWVEPDARRAGVARALVAAVAAEARRQGRAFVWWCSHTDNEAANRLYATLADIHEPIVAHALAFDAFDRLAAEGEP